MALAIHVATSFNAEGHNALAQAAILAAATRIPPYRKPSMWRRFVAVMTTPIVLR